MSSLLVVRSRSWVGGASVVVALVGRGGLRRRGGLPRRGGRCPGSAALALVGSSPAPCRGVVPLPPPLGSGALPGLRVVAVGPASARAAGAPLAAAPGSSSLGALPCATFYRAIPPSRGGRSAAAAPVAEPTAGAKATFNHPARGATHSNARGSRRRVAATSPAQSPHAADPPPSYPPPACGLFRAGRRRHGSICAKGYSRNTIRPDTEPETGTGSPPGTEKEQPSTPKQARPRLNLPQRVESVAAPAAWLRQAAHFLTANHQPPAPSAPRPRPQDGGTRPGLREGKVIKKAEEPN